MNLKYLIYSILFSLLLVSTHVFAQKNNSKDSYKEATSIRKAREAAKIADRYFDNYEYYLAAQEYLNATIEDQDYLYAIYQLAESYRLYFNYDKAQKYYKTVLDKDSTAFPLTRYWYASMLKNQSEYSLALENFEQFIKEYPASQPNASELKAKARIDADGCILAINELKKPVRNYSFHGIKGPLNTGASEYAPVIFDHDTSLVITSARTGTLGGKDFNVLGGKFSDLFRFTKGKDSTWIPVQIDDKFSDLNTEFNDGTGSFTKDKKKFYFTRADEKFVSQNYIDYLPAIYVSVFEGGKWSKAIRLNENINAKGEYNAEPSISPNGDTLYFVSKRPGGKGQHDIYYSVSDGEENWKPAVNMKEINTPFIEKSPCFYSKENTLFFSTNGREGFGGLDIFKATGKEFKDIENIGLPFNSNMDDFYFVLGEDKGYLASNREGGMGNDDIYFFNIRSSEAVIAEIKLDSLLAEIRRDSILKTDELAAINNGESGLDQQSSDNNNQGPGQIKSISIVGTVLYNDTREPAPGVENTLKNKDGKVLKTTKTNNEGNFRFDNLPLDDYKVEIEDTDPRLTGEVKYIVEDVKVKTSEKEVSRKFFENIYFNFDNYTLRSEDKKVLRELVDFYKKNPEIQIEMSANTDSFGSSEYNKALSQKRGDAALDYLVSKGVDRAALVVNPQGESNPLATNANAAGRQLNRRVEFYIIGGPGYQAQAMTYIADPNATIEQIASTFNMTVAELKALNALDNTKLEAYQPLRVRRTGDADMVAPITLSMIEVAGEDSIGTTSVRTVLRQSKPQIYRRSNTLRAGEEYFVVAPQNTLFSIARLFGMSLDELMSLNSLTSDKIEVGQKVVVKVRNFDGQLKSNQYLVKEGDSIDSIAKKFNLTIEKLVELNRITGYKLYENMILRVK
jgi:peptidoglycan-associated lipoprotein